MSFRLCGGRWGSHIPGSMEWDSCGVGASLRASRFTGSLVSCGALPPLLGHAEGADGAALFWLCYHNSPELQIASADPLGKTRLIIQHDLPPPAICVIVHWSSWKCVILRYRTMQNLFLQCKSISMYKTFATSATIYKPVASGNHMLL